MEILMSEGVTGQFIVSGLKTDKLYEYLNERLSINMPLNIKLLPLSKYIHDVALPLTVFPL